MDKKQGYTSVQFEQFFKALGLPSDLLKEKRKELSKAGVLKNVGNQDTIIISDYGEYALSELGKCQKRAVKTNSLNDIDSYKSLAIAYLDEWISILFIDFELDYSGVSQDLLKEIEADFRETLADSKAIYEHYYCSLEMYLNLVFSEEQDEIGTSTGGQT